MVISTILLFGGLAFAAFESLPSKFILFDVGVDVKHHKHAWQAYLCSCFGLISGFIIGVFTEFMTSFTYPPVR